ncbi:MAG: hypothetical protein A2Y73_06790 [Chloroflexi bacterium RBG_13_56_8]|nr:MAG: hypothetical protein A2Y73_06790 [Chloroflexi bacterium RBG_13_56_8]
MNPDDYHLVDLTLVIVPDTGERPVHIEQVPAPDAVPGGSWYVMHKVEMHLNHVGTHIEAPYHVCQEGKDVSSVPLESLCGDAVVLDLTFVKAGGVVELEDVQRAAEVAGGVRRGDIVLARFDYDGSAENGRSFAPEAITYLVDAGMKLMGVDLLGISSPRSDPRRAQQHNHHQLLDRDICLIERVANLDQLTKSRVLVFAFPYPIQGLDSFPLRVVALEEL